MYWRVDNFIDNDYPLKHDLKFNLMERFIETIESGVAIDDLINIVEGTNEYMGDNAPVEVEAILNLAIDEEFNETRDRIDELLSNLVYGLIVRRPVGVADGSLLSLRQ